MINHNTIKKLIQEVKENYNYTYRNITPEVIKEILNLFKEGVEYTNYEQYEIVEEYILENIAY